MFENLSDRLSGVLDRLTRQGALSEEDVKTALREVRVALLEADVSLPVARDFIKRGPAIAFAGKHLQRGAEHKRAVLFLDAGPGLSGGHFKPIHTMRAAWARSSHSGSTRTGSGR